MKKNEKYMSCVDIKSCPYGKFCGTCMFRDNQRSITGFKLDELESGMYDFCVLFRREDDGRTERENN